MSSGPQTIVSQPGGASGKIYYFGDAPYPTSGDLRAGNDAGLIFAYRNWADTLDYAGWGLGVDVLTTPHPDSLVLGGWLSVNHAKHLLTTDLTPFASHATIGGANSAGAGDFRDVSAPARSSATGTVPGLGGNLFIRRSPR